MEERIYWVSPFKWEHEQLRWNIQLNQIQRCFNASHAIMAATMWTLGLLPFYTLKDHNWNVLIITDERYKLILNRLALSNRDNCIFRILLYLAYKFLMN